jgi:cytochrome c peroxidase
MYLFSLLLFLLVLTPSTIHAQSTDLVSLAKKFFKPLPSTMPAPADNPTTPEKVALGKMLYYEARLSKGDEVSCSTCHNLATGGVDNLPTSFGHLAQRGGRNAPTVFNAGLQIAQFWDGRAPSLEEQAKGPPLNPVEMALPNQEAAIERLSSMPEYVERFKKAFPGEKKPLTYDNIAKAIAAFERTLLTPSRFDKFLTGDAAALSANEQQGLQLVIKTGCITCHNGVGAGGGMYQKFGIFGTYEGSDDPGRVNVTHNEKDRFVFKVPMWRNVTRTAPYFNNGSVWDLKEAIRIMGKIQLNKQLTNEEVDRIADFLGSLEGNPPQEAMTLPVLPASTPSTPLPDFTK